MFEELRELSQLYVHVALAVKPQPTIVTVDICNAMVSLRPMPRSSNDALELERHTRSKREFRTFRVHVRDLSIAQ